ncbi:hypothetical protein ABIB82_003085 [Bradyrhizobium sp. i1.8.4]|uniref:hypothetical protein n=1 Tax=unclassified Bradyrhizobium TaxID=2631580 RepID=UPI003D1AD5D8
MRQKWTAVLGAAVSIGLFLLTIAKRLADAISIIHLPHDAGEFLTAMSKTPALIAYGALTVGIICLAYLVVTSIWMPGPQKLARGQPRDADGKAQAEGGGSILPPTKHHSGNSIGIRGISQSFFIGGGGAFTAPYVHILIFIHANAPAIIKDMYVRVTSGTAQDFRLWMTRDFANSEKAHPVRTTAVRIPDTGREVFSDFHISEPHAKTSYRLAPGHHELSVFANDENGVELTIKDDINFELTEQDVAALINGGGWYFDWNSNARAYQKRPG